MHVTLGLPFRGPSYYTVVLSGARGTLHPQVLDPAPGLPICQEAAAQPHRGARHGGPTPDTPDLHELEASPCPPRPSVGGLLCGLTLTLTLIGPSVGGLLGGARRGERLLRGDAR